MTNPKVTIDVEANTNKAQANMKGFAANTAQAMSGIRDALGLAQQGMQYIDKVFQATIGETVAYAESVRQLSRVSGTSAEETSRLIQMTDDLGVELGTLETAARGAAMKGIVLSTDSLAKMSDEYLKLAPGVERNTYLLENFGRSGLEMARVLEKGSKSITTMAEAISDNMIMTQEAVDQAREYEIALDNLNDSVTGLKYSIGNQLLPATTKLIDVLSGPNARTAAEFINTVFKDTFIESEKSKGLRSIAQGIDNLSRGYRKMGEEILKANSATKKMTTAAWELFTPLKDVADQTDLMAQHTAELKAQQDGLNTIWGLASAAVSKLTNDELMRATIEDELAIASGKLTQADIDRRDLVNGLTQAYIDGKLSRAEYIADLKAIGDGTWGIVDGAQRLMELNGQSSNVTFTVNGQDPASFYANYGIGAGWGSGGKDSTPLPTPPPKPKPVKKVPIPQAEGGDYLVNKPTLFMAGEAGPERATFTPQGQGLSGNSEIVSLLRDIKAKPGLDEYKLAKLIRDAVLQAVG